MKHYVPPKLSVKLELNSFTRTLNIHRWHIVKSIVSLYLESNAIDISEIDDFNVDFHAGMASNTRVWIDGIQQRNQKFHNYILKMMNEIIA